MTIPYNRRRNTYRTRNTRWSDTTTRSGNWRRTTSSAKSGASSRSFNTVKNEIQTKINSFQHLYATTAGGKTNWCPTPATIHKFANWVDKGAVIHKVTRQQVAKWARAPKPYTTPTAAFRALKGKFGTAVKGVTYGPSGNFLVATNYAYKGKPFRFPK